MAKKEAVKKKEVKIEHIVCSAIATDDGFYKGRIIKTGEKFEFQGVTKDGRFPNWVKAVGKVKVVAGPKAKAEVKSPIVQEEIEDEEADVSDLV